MSRPTMARARRAGGRVALILVLVLTAYTAGGAVLFPEPLHLVRTITDPVGGSTTRVDEYCVGNRVISVSGNRVSIADYERQELTEIDRSALTFSITPFPELAKANARSGRRPVAISSAQKQKRLATKSLGSKRSAAGRTVEMYQIGETDESRVTVAIDRSVSVSREAAAVLAGSAYPNAPSIHHDALLAAAASGDKYGLLAEQSTDIEAAGETFTVKNTVVEVSRDLPPPELTSIPNGARRIESKIVAIPRMLDELEKPPNQVPRRP